MRLGETALVRTTRLRVSLRDVDPPVERVVDLPATSTLAEVHQVLQAAMGWVAVHLHEFEADGVRYQPDPEDDDAVDEGGLRLRGLGARWTYLYDFGDGWMHDVEVLGAGGEPGLVDGRGGCPLEDCGGTYGFERLQAILADPDHPEHGNAVAWVGGELPGFDLASRDLAVRPILGAVPESVRITLDALGSGTTLTPAGHLPRSVLHAVQEHRPSWAYDEKPVRMEQDLWPLAALREVLRECGLLRMRHGALVPTKAAADDLEIVRRLRSWFAPDDGFTAVLTSAALVRIVQDGPIDADELAERIHDDLGPRWQIEGRPMTPSDLRWTFGDLSSVLRGLDLIVDDEDHPRYLAGPGALWLLPTVSRIVANEGPAATQPHYRSW
ncbi:plasmid pRiA4b ORF-3 family protein [Actinomycetospora sp. CA-084318]|uniref:plasmid pRiA4b ORF-3 family protein n=1 Tax=Actinomycetospora sp. CA-084318 TaxID=3239892 RepID=UPI003D958C1A